jgi:hypothetical protein
VLPSSLSFALMDFDIFSIFWISIVSILVIGLFVLLVFKSSKIVTLLKLDKGFDNDKIELGNFQPSDIIKIGTFIIGGLLIINNIPGFLSHSLFAFKGNIIGMDYETQAKFNWAISGLNLLIGYLLITNYGFIAKKLKTDDKNKMTR